MARYRKSNRVRQTRPSRGQTKPSNGDSISTNQMLRRCMDYSTTPPQWSGHCMVSCDGGFCGYGQEGSLYSQDASGMIKDGFDVQSLQDCVSCGSNVSSMLGGGYGTLEPCFKCRDYLGSV